MKWMTALWPLAGFGLGLGLIRAWPDSSGGAGPGKPDGRNAGDLVPEAVASAGKQPGGAAEPAAADGLPGLREKSGEPGTAPTMDGVFAANGLDRMLLMARWIQSATSAELAEAIDRANAEEPRERSFADQAWLRWVEIDLPGALERKDSHELWWAWTKLDPQAALASALQDKPGSRMAVIHSLGQSDPALAQRLLAEHPDANIGFAMSGILDGLEKSDPGAAVLLSRESSGNSFEVKFKFWLGRDPEAARAWLGGQSDPGLRRPLEKLVLDELIAEDPAAGLAVAGKLPAGRAKLDSSVAAIGAMAGKDPAAARAAAEAMPSAYGRQKALIAVAEVLTSSDPAQAVSMIPALEWSQFRAGVRADWEYSSPDGTSSSSGSSGDGDVDKLLGALMATAPAKSLEALGALPEPASTAISTGVSTWAARDPETASLWLKDQPAGEARDAGISGLTGWLSSVGQQDYEAALAWTAAASPEKQSSLYQNTFRNWQRQDPQAAAAALESLPVPESEKISLRTLFR